jgi:hypothetical protein
LARRARQWCALQDAHELEELRAEARRTLERVAEPHGDDALAQV